MAVCDIFSARNIFVETLQMQITQILYDKAAYFYKVGPYTQFYGYLFGGCTNILQVNLYGRRIGPLISQSETKNDKYN